MKNPYDRFKDERLEELQTKRSSFRLPIEDEIIDIYERFLSENRFNTAYFSMAQDVSKLKISSSDIKAFEKLLPSYEEWDDYSWKSGMFLTQLVNSMKEDEIGIDLTLSWKKIGHVGYMLKEKRIIVKGDVGACLGMGMESGEIIVNGDADQYVGHNMKGGKVTVNGKAKSAGSCMEGGIVEIRETDGDPKAWKSWKDRGELWVSGEKIW